MGRAPRMQKSMGNLDLDPLHAQEPEVRAWVSGLPQALTTQ